MREIKVTYSGLRNILNVDKFRKRLEEIEGIEIIDRQNKEYVLVYLRALRERENEAALYGHG